MDVYQCVDPSGKIYCVHMVMIGFLFCMLLLKEGACIITGISYDGVDKSGVPQWGAASNVHVLKFESSYMLQVCCDVTDIS